MPTVRKRIGALSFSLLLFFGVVPAAGAPSALAQAPATDDAIDEGPAGPPVSDAVDEDGPAGPTDDGADSTRAIKRANDVSGGPDAHRAGAWSPAVEWPLSAIHAILLPDGKVMTYGTDGAGRPSYSFSYDIWNPAKGLGPDSHTTLPVKTSTNLFCSAQTVLPWSGQVLITGGEENGFPGGAQNDAVNDVNLFDPDSATVTRMANSMAHARWYPTVTTLPNGEILVHGGRDDKPGSEPALVPEVYSPANGWRRLTSAASTGLYGSGRWYYPRSWVAPNGKVFIVTKGDRGMWSLDPAGKGSVTRLGTYPGSTTSNATPAAMFDTGRILITTETGSASVIDINGASPRVTPTDALRAPRGWSDATVLADGQVLVTGGASQRQKLEHAIEYAEIWNPETGTWAKGASASKARLYHSTAMLLPDATVLTAGGGPPGPVVNLNAEIYHPPYLFKRDGSGELAERPRISSVGDVRYGDPFAVDVADGAQISKVALVRTGSVTHSFDMDQRFMELDFEQSGGALTVAGPRNARVAPPGQYMLFVFDDAGVPSEAKLLRLNTAAPPTSTAVQTGNLTLANTEAGGDWITAMFERPFDRTPVVTVGAPSTAGWEPAVARVRNVTRTGFQVKIDEWDYQDGEHTLETVSYLAAEPGRHALGGVTIEAGAMNGGADWSRVTYAGQFGAAPVVLAQIASDFDGATVTTRIRNIHKTGFDVRLQEQEANEVAGRRHGQETVHYIALSRGSGQLAGRPLRVGSTGVVVTNAWRTRSFGDSFAAPGLIAGAQTTKGTDLAAPRYRRLTSSGAQLRMQEEASHDSEATHTAERIGYVVIGAK